MLFLSCSHFEESQRPAGPSRAGMPYVCRTFGLGSNKSRASRGLVVEQSAGRTLQKQAVDDRAGRDRKAVN